MIFNFDSLFSNENQLTRSRFFPTTAEKKGGRLSDQSDYDGQSISTVSLGGSSIPDRDADFYLDELPDDPFEINVDKLSEKRGATREDGLQKLIGLFIADFQYEEAVFRQETFAQAFIGSIRRGGPAEAALAANALGLHVLTLGTSEGAESVFQDARSVFEPLILTGRSTASRAAAVDAMGMMCFVASEGPHETMEIINLLVKAIEKGPAQVQAPALRSWSLLLTTVPAWKLGTSFVEAHLSWLTALLHSDNLEVRKAAGEAIALLFDTCGLSDLPSKDWNCDSAEDENGEMEGENGNGVHPSTLDDIVDRMRDLATNKGDPTRRSKKERAEQKGTFRELMNVVEEGAVVEQKIKLGSDVLIVNTLPQSIRLNAMRRYLGSGFQIHLMYNPFLHDVFSFRPSNVPAERLSAKEKRLYRSQTSVESKGKSQHRKRERQAMSAYKSSMLATSP
jgi:hypothetical protein